MLHLLWLIPALPLLGFLLLALFGGSIPRALSAVIGVGSVGVSALIMLLVGISFLSSPPQGNAFVQHLWTWFHVGNFQAGISFHLDALSLVMIFVVTFVGFLIHLYSSEFMADDDGFSRFFAYMNLFVSSMLILVLADNLLLLYLGWEGVGLCSYLLIGFWYKDPENGHAARKAFVVTRVGDTAMAIGLFILATQLGTLNIQEILRMASEQWPVGSGLAIATSALLLGGAVGKSAQLPLQTWLPDAMAGPTPVSALIHAATMVTAGVYLIARTNVLYTLAPVVQSIVAIVGLLTLLLAGFSALTKRDIKRVLAYSTISQIGYMFLALGVGAYSAAMLHFMVHAFFKALLFLGAGVLIHVLHHEHDMFKMGGLRKKLPVTFWTFLVASASLAAVPLITAGFYSKDAIIWESWASESGSPWLWAGALLGALLTAIYTFRMVFVTFYGEAKMEPSKIPGFRLKLPLIVLGVLSVIGGFVETPETLGHITVFSDVMHSVLPEVHSMHATIGTELLFQIIAAVVALGGIYIAYYYYVRKPQAIESLTAKPAVSTLHRFWESGWGFDWLYYSFIVDPYIWIARINKNDIIDVFYTAIARLTQMFYYLFSLTQTGRIRNYAAGIVFGAIIILAIMVLS